MRRFILGLAVYCSAVLSITPPASSCEGGLLQTHQPAGGFHFQTASEVRDFGGYKTAVICAKNLSKGRDTHLVWFIPTLQGWIPPEESILKERLIRTGSVSGVESCVEYGNRGEWTRAAFFGDDIDHQESSEERSAGCAGARDKYHGQAQLEGIAPPDELKLSITTFFPSDPDNASDTMLELYGSIVLTRLNDKQYEILLSLFLERYKGREMGNVGEVVVTPSAEHLPAHISSIFKENIPEKTKLEDIIGKKFVVDYLDDGVFGEVVLNIASKPGEHLARISIPALGSIGN